MPRVAKKRLLAKRRLYTPLCSPLDEIFRECNDEDHNEGHQSLCLECTLKAVRLACRQAEAPLLAAIDQLYHELKLKRRKSSSRTTD
jgi:hypothetical protein